MTKKSNVVHELAINVFNDIYQVVWIPGCTALIVGLLGILPADINLIP